jgi:arylsulfatase A-like enzyme
MWGAHGLSGKWNMYEESIRVPLMIRDPRLSASTHGQRSQMALNIDIAPTIVAMAGLPVPDEMQGMNLSLILHDPTVTGRADWYYEHDVATESGGKPLPRCEGVRSERWKYIRYKDTKPLQEELFDLQNDPLEEHNLAKEKTHAATLAKMSARCNELRKALR